MVRAPRTAVTAALGALCLVAVSVNSAPPAEAVGVVDLLSGLLSVSIVPATATLTTSAGVASGSLGTTTIIDGRALASSYDVSMSTAGFDLVGALSSTSATHIAASAVTVQNTAVTGGTSSRTSAVALPSASPIFRVTYSSGVLSVNLVSTYTMSMSLTVPAGLAAGLYTGTVTQTVA
jgi:hypothetical protein